VQFGLLFFLLPISSHFIIFKRIGQISWDPHNARRTQLRLIVNALLPHFDYFNLLLETLDVPSDIIRAEALMIRHHANLVLRHHIILRFSSNISTLVEGRGAINVREAFLIFVVTYYDLDGILYGCHGYAFLHHVEVYEGVESQERCVDVLALSLKDGIGHNRQSLVLAHNQLMLGQLGVLALPIVENFLLNLLPRVYVDGTLLTKRNYLIDLL
jgi:hypothetical protein